MFKQKKEEVLNDEKPVVQESYDFISAAGEQEESKELSEFSQVAIPEEETKILWDYYATQEDLGLERFENSLTQHSSFAKDIVQSKDLNDLSSLIDQTNRKLQMQFKREHKYDLKIYEEQLYKEVMFDARPNQDQGEEYRLNNTLRKAKYSGSIRNMTQDYDAVKKVIQFPEHKKVPYKIKNMHEASSIIDPFHWVQDMNSTQLDNFLQQEGQFTRLMLMKYDYLDKMILREFDHFKQTEQIEPIQIGAYIYYRKADNAADNLTLYRFPIDELDKYGLKASEVPYFRKPSIEDLDEEMEEYYLKLEKEFPEDVLFTLSDLVEFY